MATKYADRVKQVTTTTGTGAYSIAGSADTGCQRFNDAFSVGDTVYYCVVMGAAWEVGIGTVGIDTLARTEILDSSTGSAIDWAAGDKSIFQVISSDIMTDIQAHIDSVHAPSNAEANRTLDAIPTSGNIANSVSSDGVFTSLAGKSDTNHNHTGVYAPVLGADDNYVTDAEKIVIGNTSGTNTGDQEVIELLASDPASPATGEQWINTTDNQLKIKTSTGTIIFDAYQYIAD